MKGKKIISILICFCMVLMIVGCSNNNDQDTPETIDPPINPIIPNDDGSPEFRALYQMYTIWDSMKNLGVEVTAEVDEIKKIAIADTEKWSFAVSLKTQDIETKLLMFASGVKTDINSSFVGKVDGNVYTNNLFGFKINIPADFAVVDIDDYFWKSIQEEGKKGNAADYPVANVNTFDFFQIQKSGENPDGSSYALSFKCTATKLKDSAGEDVYVIIFSVTDRNTANEMLFNELINSVEFFVPENALLSPEQNFLLTMKMLYAAALATEGAENIQISDPIKLKISNHDIYALSLSSTTGENIAYQDSYCIKVVPDKIDDTIFGVTKDSNQYKFKCLGISLRFDTMYFVAEDKKAELLEEIYGDKPESITPNTKIDYQNLPEIEFFEIKNNDGTLNMTATAIRQGSGKSAYYLVLFNFNTVDSPVANVFSSVLNSLKIETPGTEKYE